MTQTIMSLTVSVSQSRQALGQRAAKDVCAVVGALLAQKESVNMIFAAAPSQAEFLECLRGGGIDFSRVNAFHMDDYIGLDDAAPQLFANFLRRHLFDLVSFRSVHYINGSAADPLAECRRYAALLEEYPPDIVCMGIGENAHIAFNDPGIARLRDKELVKVVTLDEASRLQQVHDGCFPQIGDVPERAITLTIPALLRADYQFCMVPAASKADAVREALYGPIDENCPASLLRTCQSCRLYLDEDSSAKLPLLRG